MASPRHPAKDWRGGVPAGIAMPARPCRGHVIVHCRSDGQLVHHGRHQRQCRNCRSAL